MRLSVFSRQRDSVSTGFRVINKKPGTSDDVVPHLPQEDLGYLHTPHEAYQKDEVKPDLTYCADSATKEDDACSNSCYPLGCTSVVDHLSYLGLVQGIGGCIEL